MWHDVIYGLLLGYGAAVPIGPMNLEMIRRNLLYGYKTGVSFGLGACCVDTTFMIFLGLGALEILQSPKFLNVIGFCGALVLFWFAYKAWGTKVAEVNMGEHQKIAKPWWQHMAASYMLTMINPFTIIFWSSVSSQAALLVTHDPHAFWVLAPSVLVATLSWVLGLNTVLYFTRDKISIKTMKTFNRIGAVLLAGFGIYGLLRVFL
jgi:L-lysine exporter family protein LysE/ArgO